ncbi:MAG: 50S ribosomal protein L18 [Candidatus Latescibacteria bacterium]|nr:50S ribosomal protein L18 [Candidatus Latescibacterota bacterium]
MEKKFKKVEDYKRWRRHKRVRNRVVGTQERPRVCVFRSNQHIYAQLIDDETGRTLLSVSSLKMEAPAAKKAEAKAEKAEAKAEGKKGGKAAKADKPAKAEKGAASVGGKKTALAREVGRLLAEAAQAKGFKKVAFDRGGYLYHGRVAALATSAREHGLDF